MYTAHTSPPDSLFDVMTLRGYSCIAFFFPLAYSRMAFRCNGSNSDGLIHTSISPNRTIMKIRKRHRERESAPSSSRSLSILGSTKMEASRLLARRFDLRDRLFAKISSFIYIIIIIMQIDTSRRRNCVILKRVNWLSIFCFFFFFEFFTRSRMALLKRR